MCQTICVNIEWKVRDICGAMKNYKLEVLFFLVIDCDSIKELSSLRVANCQNELNMWAKLPVL